MNKFKVITFGSAIADLFLESKEFKLVKQADQKTAICQLYEDKVEVDKRTLTSGGGGTNTAVSFSRLGLETAIVAKLGQDPLGRLIREELNKEKVNTDFLVEQTELTDCSVILIGPDGGRTILVSRGRNRLESVDIDKLSLESDWFYIASLEGNLGLINELVGFAKKKGIKVAWNPGKRELEQKGEIKELAPQVEVILLNREEANSLLGTDLAQKSFPLVERPSLPYFIVTDGPQGAYLFEKDKKEPFYLSAPSLVPCDSTGAGDAFGSGFVAGLIKGMSSEEAFQLAMKNSVSVIQQVGAKAGLLKL